MLEMKAEADELDHEANIFQKDRVQI